MRASWLEPGSMLSTTVLALLCATWPILLPSLLTTITRLHNFIFPPYRTYATSEDEQRYWRSAAAHRRRLASSNARSHETLVPVVPYYAPRLLPLYRTPRAPEAEAAEYRLSPKTFFKWHRMVFPGRVSPCARYNTAASPSHARHSPIRVYSSRDRREIYRISRMLHDEAVFQRGEPATQKYTKLWTEWLDTKGPDITIIFE